MVRTWPSEMHATYAQNGTLGIFTSCGSSMGVSGRCCGIVIVEVSARPRVSRVLIKTTEVFYGSGGRYYESTERTKQHAEISKRVHQKGYHPGRA